MNSTLKGIDFSEAGNGSSKLLRLVKMSFVIRRVAYSYSKTTRE